MATNKAIMAWLAASLAVMFLLPFAVAGLASENSGMALCMILFFIVNPIYSAILGYRCGKDAGRMWNLPLASAIAFLATTWIIFDIHEPLFTAYAGAYLAIGYIAMAISRHAVKSDYKVDAFPFSDSPDTAVFTCSHIAESGDSILYVSHDLEDGAWQFLCGKEHNEDEARIVSLRHIFEMDPTIGKLKDLPMGYYAERESKNGKWTIKH